MHQRILPAVILSLGLSAASAATFVPLADLPGGSFSSRAYGVSADGSVVVGYGDNGPERAFRWTAATGMVDLGGLPGGGMSSARGVSADGSVVTGFGSSAASSMNNEAFVWTASGGMVGLGDLPGGVFFSFGFGVSADGATVVGRGYSSANEAFAWTNGSGMVGLGDLPGGVVDSTATAASSNGSVIIGYSKSGLGTEAFRWTQSDGLVGLGDLPGGGVKSRAYGVSYDGSVVVGEGDVGGSNSQAFRWTATGGMVGLGYLPGGFMFSQALGVSGDGSTVVGNSQSANGAEAFVWTQAAGMQSLRDLLVQRGATGLSGWTLATASAASSDGEWVVGWGTNPSGREEAFLANINAVPIPAAVWLFGGALGALSLLRRLGSDR